MTERSSSCKLAYSAPCVEGELTQMVVCGSKSSPFTLLDIEIEFLEADAQAMEGSFLSVIIFGLPESTQDRFELVKDLEGKWKSEGFIQL